MITVKAPDTETVEIKSKWEELTPKEYLFVVKLVILSNTGKIDVDEFRQMYLMYITNYKPSTRLDQEQQEEVDSNLYLLSQQIDFFFKKNEKGQNELNINFTKNLIPEFRFKQKKYTGPEFYLSKLGDIRTNLKADTFIDAQEYYNLYLQTQKTEALDMLVAIFYGNYKKGYTTFRAQKQSAKFAKLDFNIKYAVYLFFRALLNLIATRTHLGILFRRNENTEDQSQENKIELGLSKTVYSLVKAGYGTGKEVGEMLFTKYLEALLNEIQDSVRAMKVAEKKITDIAKDTRIPIDIINQLL